MKQRRRTRRRLTLFLIALLFLCEPAARFVYAHQPPPPGEHLNYLSGKTGYLIPADFDGRTYHVRNGIRLTVGNPARYVHTVWMLGNSGLMGFRVPDADTIPSKLQALLPDWRVLNLSAEGQLIRGQLAWLKELPIQPGDIVIFVDGTMDALFLRERARQVTPWLRHECALSIPQRFSAVLDLALCAVVFNAPMDKAELAETARAFRQTIEDARRYSLSRCAEFYHFYQPGLVRYFFEPGAVLAGDGPMLSVPSADYLDDAGHVNAHGAALVARQIYDKLTVF